MSADQNNQPDAAQATENLQLQRDELVALESIYPDYLIRETDEDALVPLISHHSCILSLPISAKKTLDLILTFPLGYPSHAAPFFDISSEWYSKGVLLAIEQTTRERISQEFEAIWETQRGQAVVFSWVAWLLEFLKDEFKDNEAEIDIHGPLDDTIGSVGAEKRGNVGLDELESPTSTTELLKPDFPIHVGPTITINKSTFVSHCASVTTQFQIKQFLKYLKSDKKIAKATHNIVAYRFTPNPETPNVIVQDYDDDGEAAAGSRLLHLLQLLDAQNVVVCTTRWFGGVLLGPERFKLICNNARDALKTGGFVTEKSGTVSKKRK